MSECIVEVEKNDKKRWAKDVHIGDALKLLIQVEPNPIYTTIVSMTMSTKLSPRATSTSTTLPLALRH